MCASLRPDTLSFLRIQHSSSSCARSPKHGPPRPAGKVPLWRRSRDATPPGGAEPHNTTSLGQPPSAKDGTAETGSTDSNASGQSGGIKVAEPRIEIDFIRYARFSNVAQASSRQCPSPEQGSPRPVGNEPTGRGPFAVPGAGTPGRFATPVFRGEGSPAISRPSRGCRCRWMAARQTRTYIKQYGLTVKHLI